MGSCGVGLGNGFNTLWRHGAREVDETSVLRSARGRAGRTGIEYS